jgi:uncharacterized protein (TIGR03437 family)
LPLAIQLRDASGRPAPSSSVEFRVLEGSVTLSAEEIPTDAQGQAAVILTAGSRPGPVRVQVISGSLSLVFNLSVLGRTPAATAMGLVNAGSYAPGWVPGGAGAIFGEGLSEVEGVLQPSTFPFPAELAGVRVFVNGVAAPILALARVNGVEQINIQVPFETPAPRNDITVRIENNGASTNVTGVRTLSIQPGIFELTLPGGRIAAALHLDFSLVEPANPARPGETILLFVTGLGPTTPPVVTNQAGPADAAEVFEDVMVAIGGIDAQVLGAFYAPGLTTAYQVNLVVPSSAPPGSLGITVTAAGVSSQSAVLPVGQ